MSVENVTGFVQGEILSLKKVTDSGFSTEYVFVNESPQDKTHQVTQTLVDNFMLQEDMEVV